MPNYLRVYYDTEFLDTANGTDLISIGLTGEDGRELYMVNDDAPWDDIAADPWLMENVVAKLYNTPAHFDPLGKPIHGTHSEIAERVSEFLVAPPGYDYVELWAYFAAYDHYLLSKLFGRMLDMPRHIPQYTNDVRQLRYQFGNHPVPRQPSNLEHHALEDARHDQLMHRYLLSTPMAANLPTESDDTE